jgi:hypothetical protein
MSNNTKAAAPSATVVDEKLKNYSGLQQGELLLPNEIILPFVLFSLLANRCSEAYGSKANCSQSVQ